MEIYAIFMSVTSLLFSLGNYSIASFVQILIGVYISMKWMQYEMHECTRMRWTCKFLLTLSISTFWWDIVPEQLWWQHNEELMYCNGMMPGSLILFITLRYNPDGGTKWTCCMNVLHENKWQKLDVIQLPRYWNLQLNLSHFSPVTKSLWCREQVITFQSEKTTFFDSRLYF